MLMNVILFVLLREVPIALIVDPEAFGYLPAPSPERETIEATVTLISVDQGLWCHDSDKRQLMGLLTSSTDP